MVVHEVLAPKLQQWLPVVFLELRLRRVGCQSSHVSSLTYRHLVRGSTWAIIHSLVIVRGDARWICLASER